jgi:hypothetical protein
MKVLGIMNINKIIGFSLLAASVGTSFQATAASTELTITGEIASEACNVVIANDGIFDYGDIENAKIESGKHTALPVKSYKLEVTCPAPIYVGFILVDNRDGTQSRQGAEYFGLGTDNKGNPLGYVQWAFGYGSGLNGDMKVVFAQSPIGTPNWTKLNGGGLMKSTNMYTWTKSASGGSDGTPAPIDINASIQVESHTFIAPRENLNMSQEINLDGSTTVELFYF